MVQEAEEPIFPFETVHENRKAALGLAIESYRGYGPADSQNMIKRAEDFYNYIVGGVDADSGT